MTPAAMTYLSDRCARQGISCVPWHDFVAATPPKGTGEIIGDPANFLLHAQHVHKSWRRLQAVEICDIAFRQKVQCHLYIDLCKYRSEALHATQTLVGNICM